MMCYLSQLIMAVIRDIKELIIRVSLYRFLVTVNAGIGTRDTYADIAATLAQIFEIEYHGDGTGFLEMLK